MGGDAGNLHGEIKDNRQRRKGQVKGDLSHAATIRHRGIPHRRYGRAYEHEDAQKGDVAHGDKCARRDGGYAVKPRGHEAHVGEQQAGLEAPDAQAVA